MIYTCCEFSWTEPVHTNKCLLAFTEKQKKTAAVNIHRWIFVVIEGRRKMTKCSKNRYKQASATIQHIIYVYIYRVPTRAGACTKRNNVALPWLYWYIYIYLLIHCYRHCWTYFFINFSVSVNDTDYFQKVARSIRCWRPCSISSFSGEKSDTRSEFNSHLFFKHLHGRIAMKFLPVLSAAISTCLKCRQQCWSSTMKWYSLIPESHVT